ncbi:uncharacterized protein LOC114541971 [Dendronephthya gigantea]|uniref:uncharacterized protein LOC114541971 n=1 Tax=Dendronephthya gigantea TaxID=151771 RepID=UPI0010694765|nr:uncharacterized protein LOC114541971 [Dendronephthya gigantea]
MAQENMSLQGVALSLTPTSSPVVSAVTTSTVASQLIATAPLAVRSSPSRQFQPSLHQHIASPLFPTRVPSPAIANQQIVSVASTWPSSHPSLTPFFAQQPPQPVLLQSATPTVTQQQDRAVAGHWQPPQQTLQQPLYRIQNPVPSGAFVRAVDPPLPESRILFPLVSRVSPLQYVEFHRELINHPNQAMVRYVLDGIAHGFPSGFDPSLVSLRPSHRNMKSALQHPDVIDKYLANEISHGRVVGPFASPPFPNLQCSPFWVIPKKGQPGKRRLIQDLSSPEGHSVNDGIPKDPFSLTYISVDHAIARLYSLVRVLLWPNLT